MQFSTKQELERIKRFSQGEVGKKKMILNPITGAKNSIYHIMYISQKNNKIQTRKPEKSKS